MELFRNSAKGWGAIWGFVYGLVALGFYFASAMLALLGIASLSTTLALIEILPQNFWMHFSILALLLLGETILLYLRSHSVRRLMVPDRASHRASPGTPLFAFIVSYLPRRLFIAIF